jgi:thioesterase domain-containing protein/acyl carrier protein
VQSGSAIGTPIPDLQVYILDPRGQPVPVGVTGEMYVGGAGLGRGYLDRPELTAERFVPDPFSGKPGARLYRTGDLARFLPGRDIEYLGRTDDQVKIRGFRIELGEIESLLCRYPAVREAVVLAREDSPGDKRLVAYLVADTAAATTGLIREHLKRHLPDYMLPSAFVFLKKLPLTANGKVDRRALPAPDTTRSAVQNEFIAPRDEVESKLTALWEKVLEIQPVGVRDNFFELGGHSLLGVRLFAHMEKQFSKKLPLATLFQAPTVEQLAAQLREGKERTTCSSLVAIQPKGTRPPIFFMHGAGGGNLWTYANLAPYLGADQPVYGLESRGMRGLEEFTRIEDMAAHYIEEIRTAQPRGPYYLGGYCFGGNVAYEIARQLHEQGEQIALLALMESAPPNSGERIQWWRPGFLAKFAINAAYWFNDFFHQEPADRQSFVRRKFRVLGKKMKRWFWRDDPDAAAIDLDEIIDAAQFPELELRLWEIHLRAIRDYVPGHYAGQVTLFRTRTQPFFCSFDPLYGWSELAAGGVEAIAIPGSHEKIFVEPQVRTLAAKLSACLSATQSRATHGDRP